MIELVSLGPPAFLAFLQSRIFKPLWAAVLIFSPDKVLKLYELCKDLLKCITLQMASRTITLIYIFFYRYHYYGITIKATSPYHDTVCHTARQSSTG